MDTMYYKDQQNTRASFLDELTALANSKQRQIEEIEKNLTEQKRKEFEAKIHKATDGLKEKLRKLAAEGERKYEVYRGMYDGDFHPDLSKKLHASGSGNMYCAIRDKKISYDEVIENRMGAFKRIYDFCVKEGLDPQIRYSHDGGGMEEWFEIVIRW